MRSEHLLRRLAGPALVAWFFGLFALSGANPASNLSPAPFTSPSLVSGYGPMPLRFEANQGSGIQRPRMNGIGFSPLGQNRGSNRSVLRTSMNLVNGEAGINVRLSEPSLNTVVVAIQNGNIGSSAIHENEQP